VHVACTEDRKAVYMVFCGEAWEKETTWKTYA
jgi:hypothetical protein